VLFTVLLCPFHAYLISYSVLLRSLSATFLSVCISVISFCHPGTLFFTSFFLACRVPVSYVSPFLAFQGLSQNFEERLSFGMSVCRMSVRPFVRIEQLSSLTPWSRVFLEELTSSQLVKKFYAYYGTRRFITAFTSARHLSLSWASSIQSISPHPTSQRSILILSSHLLLGLPSGLFPSGFPTETLYTTLYSLIRATCPDHLILLDFITLKMLGEEYRSLSCILFSFSTPLLPRPS
jgi:hypothetical protein